MKCDLWSAGRPCYLCEVTVKGRSNYKGHRGYREPRRPTNGARGMAIAKPRGDGAASRGSGSAPTGDWEVLFPTVTEWLSSDKFDDGSARRTSTLLIFVEDGMVKLCLSDRDGDRTGWATGQCMEGAFGALEAMLRDDRVDWRKARPAGGKKR